MAVGLVTAGTGTAFAGAAPAQSEGTSLAATAQALGLGANEKLVVKDVIKDADGTVHTRYERTYAGLPVLGGDLIVHRAPSGAVKDVTKAVNATIKVASLTPKLAPPASGQTPRQVIWAADGTPVLAYETVITGTQADGVTPSRLRVITDATTGKRLFQRETIEDFAGTAGQAPTPQRTAALGTRALEAASASGTGTGYSMYSGTVRPNTLKTSKGYQLDDTERGQAKVYDFKHTEDGAGATLFIDQDNVWGNGTPYDNQTAAVDAAYGAAKTWDFYKDVLHRNGIRADGKAAASNVHVAKGYDNAFWDDDTFAMYYGDGKRDAHPLTSLDVAGHELSHGLTAATAGLEYGNESGGLNEATSDIFGTSVEFYAKNSKDIGDYLIGEMIDINGDGTPLRYMDKPSKDAHGSADYWSPEVGNKDVHLSSGVANHFFYLLSEGSGQKEINGVKYDSPTKNGSKITGIGRDKAIQIWYRALTTYFTSTTDYHSARTGTLKAATDLYGASSAEANAVNSAWAGVNVKP
ncbi:M4 family metallopeptidase [Kitasatospora cinereorecta]